MTSSADGDMIEGEMSGEVLTLAEINSRFPSEWVLLEDPETTKSLEIIRGRLLFHGKSKDELYRQGIKFQPKRWAMLFTGPLQGNFALNL